MSKKRSWTDQELIKAVKSVRSYRAVLIALKLIPAGGNYEQVKRRINELGLTTDHFTGMGWNVGLTFYRPRVPTERLLISGSDIQSYKLKTKLVKEGLKELKCELCDWCEKSVDGRIPVELDHINGDHRDNRIENLRILCPNCHSLQTTHRGKNKRVYLARVME